MTGERSARELLVTVHDDGQGVPEGFCAEQSSRLGLQIVRTLVTSDLDGEFGLQPGAHGGTDAWVRLPEVRSNG